MNSEITEQPDEAETDSESGSSFKTPSSGDHLVPYHQSASNPNPKRVPMVKSNTRSNPNQLVVSRMKSLPSELEVTTRSPTNDSDVAGLEATGFVDIRYNSTLRGDDLRAIAFQE